MKRSEEKVESNDGGDSAQSEGTEDSDDDVEDAKEGPAPGPTNDKSVATDRDISNDVENDKDESRIKTVVNRVRSQHYFASSPHA